MQPLAGNLAGDFNCLDTHQSFKMATLMKQPSIPDKIIYVLQVSECASEAVGKGHGQGVVHRHPRSLSKALLFLHGG